MKNSVYFNTKSVVKIYFTARKETNLTFVSGVPAKQKHIFWIIPFGKSDPIVDGWETPWGDWYSDTDIKNRSMYDVDYVNKKVYMKTHLDIRFGHNDNIGQYFDTDEEAKTKIEDIINTSGHPFEVIER